MEKFQVKIHSIEVDFLTNKLKSQNLNQISCVCCYAVQRKFKIKKFHQLIGNSVQLYSGAENGRQVLMIKWTLCFQDLISTIHFGIQ